MITLIGHGYIGTHIHNELLSENLEHNWISHTDSIPTNTDYIINCAGYTGVPNVDGVQNQYQNVQGASGATGLNAGIGDPFAKNDQIGNLGDSVQDFSESNPFGKL